jgi:hypothetical protein
MATKDLPPKLSASCFRLVASLCNSAKRCLDDDEEEEEEEGASVTVGSLWGDVDAIDSRVGDLKEGDGFVGVFLFLVSFVAVPEGRGFGGRTVVSFISSADRLRTDRLTGGFIGEC